jgi:hypothetical protein
MGLDGQRISEAVADGDHTFEVPDLVGDVAAEDDAAQVTGQRDDPVRDRDGERGRVEEKPVRDHVLADLTADLLIGPGEDAEHVGPAEDADQVTVVIDDREPPELAGGQQLGGPAG